MPMPSSEVWGCALHAVGGSVSTLPVEFFTSAHVASKTTPKERFKGASAGSLELLRPEGVVRKFLEYCPAAAAMMKTCEPRPALEFSATIHKMVSILG